MKHIVLDPADGIATSAPPEFARWLSDRSRSTKPGLDVAALGLALLDANPDHVQIADARGQTLWMNQAARARAGFALDGARHCIDATHAWPRLSKATLASAIAAAERGGSSNFITSTRKGGGRCWWDVQVTWMEASTAAVGQFLVIARDVTGRHEADSALEYASTHDSLTGLARRELFHRRIEALVAEGTGLCVIMLDIDRSRAPNDAGCREPGDDALRTVGARLRRAIGRGEIAARLDGDTFGVVLRLPAGETASIAKARAQAIVDHLARPIRGATRRTRISASAGIACFPADGDAPPLLCRNAGSALIEAKSSGLGLVVRFDAALQQRQAVRAKMLARAECALAGKGILPHYQPKVDLESGRIVGFEALLRWRSPAGTIELPAGIWPAFAEPVLARRLTDSMLGRMIVDMVRWRRRGMLLPVAINVSDIDLGQADFVDRLVERLTAAGLPTSCIEIEVTENAVLGRNAEQLAAVLRKVQVAGMRVALDDFGTGYASLTHLRQLPVDVIKIDRSFVSNLRCDFGNRAIVEAMLGMARNLAIEVVAEGIETTDEARFLRDRGCTLGQGFLFGKGVPACQVMPLLAAPVPSIGGTRGDDRADVAIANLGGI